MAGFGKNEGTFRPQVRLNFKDGLFHENKFLGKDDEGKAKYGMVAIPHEKADRFSGTLKSIEFAMGGKKGEPATIPNVTVVVEADGQDWGIQYVGDGYAGNKLTAALRNLEVGDQVRMRSIISAPSSDFPKGYIGFAADMAKAGGDGQFLKIGAHNDPKSPIKLKFADPEATAFPDTPFLKNGKGVDTTTRDTEDYDSAGVDNTFLLVLPHVMDMPEGPEKSTMISHLIAHAVNVKKLAEPDVEPYVASMIQKATADAGEHEVQAEVASSQKMAA